jgi:CRISPR-associated protein Cas2
MQYVVCYDIADDRRRDRMADLLKDYGRRLQESVFLANLDGELVERMKERIQREMHPEQDSVCVFVLCAGCQRLTTAYGVAEVPVDKPYYIL